MRNISVFLKSVILSAFFAIFFLVTPVLAQITTDTLEIDVQDGSGTPVEVGTPADMPIENVSGLPVDIKSGNIAISVPQNEIGGVNQTGPGPIVIEARKCVFDPCPGGGNAGTICLPATTCDVIQARSEYFGVGDARPSDLVYLMTSDGIVSQGDIGLVDRGLYKLKNKNWGKCLNLQSGENKNGGLPNVWECTTHPDQEWYLTRAS